MKPLRESVSHAQVVTFSTTNVRQEKTSTKPQKNSLNIRSIGKIASTLFLLLLFLGNNWALQAQETYDLTICGVDVTSANCNNLSVIDGVEGSVTYDNATKTLTLQTSVIQGTNGIKSNIEGLIIKIEGSANWIDITSGSAAAIEVTESTEISGSSEYCKLDVNSFIYLNGMATYNASLKIKDCEIDIDDNKYGIAGDDGEVDEFLTIENATVKIDGNTEGSIVDIAGLTLTNCEITSPEGAVFDEDEHALVDASGNIIKSQVTIVPIEIYDLKICGVQVTSANCNDLSVIDGVEGTVTYDNWTNTLTLDGATISVTATNIIGINNYIDGLIINLQNANTVNTNNTFSSITLSQPTEISGTGALTTNSYIYLNGYSSSNASLKIKDCSIEINDDRWGLVGEDGENNELVTIENATVKATGTEEGSIRDLAGLTLTNCEITSPEGAVFDESQHAVVDANGDIITEQIVIKPAGSFETYDLQICGVDVDETNCNDLSVIDGVSGTVTYDNATKTLTLDGATINSAKIGITSNIDGLVIKLQNDNTVNSSSTLPSIAFTQPTEISGTGTLTTNSYIYIDGASTENASLKIKDCTIEVNDDFFGITGADGEVGESLTIENATVKATGSSVGSICDIASLTLVNCEITSPEGAVFDESQHAVVDANGDIITEQIVIEPTVSIPEISMNDILVYPNPTADILNIDAPSNELRVEIFNTIGQNILEISNSSSIDINPLPQGTYIVKIYKKDKISVSKIIKK